MLIPGTIPNQHLGPQSAASPVTRSRFERSQAPSFLRTVLPDNRLDTSNMMSQPDSVEEKAVRIPKLVISLDEKPKRRYIKVYHVGPNQNAEVAKMDLRKRLARRVSAGRRQIWKSHSLRKYLEDKTLAEAQIPFNALWTHMRSNTSEDTITLFDVVGLKVANLKLSLAVETDALRSAKVEIQAVKEKLQRMKGVPSALSSDSTTSVVVGLAAEIIEVVSEVHPALKIAVKFVKMAIAKAQVVIDIKERMIKLADDLTKTADWVSLVEQKRIANVQLLKDIIKKYPDTVSGAVDFIEKWVKNNFKFLDSWSEELKNLETKLVDFEKDFDRGMFMDFAIRFADSEDGRKLKEALLRGKTLEPSPQVRGCLEDTRVKLLKIIVAKIRDPHGENLIWISGYPGAGKSTLAASIMDILGQIALYFRFDRNNTQAATPEALWRIVAYMLACRYPTLQTLIQDRVFDTAFNQGTADVEKIFNDLVKEPLSKSSRDIPSAHLPVLVIDAIDEWNIEEAFSGLQHGGPIEIPTGDTAKADSDADSDIEKYLTSYLAQCECDKDLFSQAVKSLAHRSAGVFQWAKTAADIVLTSSLSEDLLELILSSEIDGDDGSLFSLYSRLLESRLPTLKKYRELLGLPGRSEGGKAVEHYIKELRVYRSMLAAMTIFKEPLTGTSEQCAQLLGIDGRVVSWVRNRLSSILNPGSLSFGHKSFVDFLTVENRHCPPELFVDTQIAKDAEQQLAFCCLAIMLDDANKGHGLRFNICHLETSAKRNMDFSNLAERIKEHIPPHLSYSCRFWAQHLVGCDFNEVLLGKVDALFRTKLLYWLEVMSLLGEINRIPSIMRSVVNWAKGGKDASFIEMVQDALRFVLGFHEPIAQSAPHIYISALPFTPRQSVVSQSYLNNFPHLLRFKSGEPLRWAPLASSIAINSSPGATIKRVAFSPDGRTYATIESGSGSITVLSEGGEVPSSTGVTFWVLINFLGSIGYCNGGRMIFFDLKRSEPVTEGQRLVFLLNADNLGSGAKLLSEILPKDERPLEADDVISFSPISSYVAVGRSCADRVVEIGLWDISDGRHVHTFRLEDCNPVVHLEFSRDGRHLLMQSLKGREIYVLDLDTKAKMGLSVKGDTQAPVIAMTYISEAQLLIRIFEIGILIWDFRTGKTVFRSPSEGQIINSSFHKNGSAFSIAARSPGGVGIRVQTYDFSSWAGMEGPVILASPPSTSQSNLDAVLRPWLPEGWRLAMEINPEDREYPYWVRLYDTNGVQRAETVSHNWHQSAYDRLVWSALPDYVDMCTVQAGISKSSESNPAPPASQNRVIISPSGHLRVLFDSYDLRSEAESIRFLHDGVHDPPSTTTGIKFACPVLLVPSLPEEESIPWTISPDDRRFAYFSASDQAVRVHDTLTGDLVFGPWHVKNSFSPMFGTSLIDPVAQQLPIGDFGDDLPIREDGWVAKRDGDLLFWVPEQMREGLYRPRNLLVVKHTDFKEDDVWGTELDLENFRHGERWYECYDPQK
ncbi:hypothetical protein NP233_g11810 [Leucocoprinus birnbaumii]|uniref:Nephrocystin 3-like N-terminal domain-containing protein n=1 Tax=Leucocoprinus birnbaumii TaxID=56174 RepID=A0AAD5VHE4_9AGAR|nr:hypothetical protein NP233_g11810 [Leucocoprinus birnbaumii]